MSEPDGVDELVAGGLRVAVTAAGLVAQRVAETRAEQARRAHAASAAEARRLEAQYDAERAAARAQLSLVERDSWWKAAKVDDVADAWQTAQSWRGVDPDVDRAAERIRTEVRDRYGVDVDVPTGIDSARLEQAVSEREAATAARRRAREAGEQLEAAVVVAADSAAELRARGAAGATEQEQEQAGVTDVSRPAVRNPDDLAHQVVAGIRAGAERDIAGRRTELADALSEVGDREAVEARLLADVSDGRPAHEAVTKRPRSAPKTRMVRTPSPRVRQRGIGR